LWWPSTGIPGQQGIKGINGIQGGQGDQGPHGASSFPPPLSPRGFTLEEMVPMNEGKDLPRSPTLRARACALSALPFYLDGNHACATLVAMICSFRMRHALSGV
jgi:hypothetical protein